MKVKNLKEFLEHQDPERRIAFTVWTEKGPKTYAIPNIPLGNNEFTDKEGRKYLLIGWIDDCPAHRVITE